MWLKVRNKSVDHVDKCNKEIIMIGITGDQVNSDLSWPSQGFLHLKYSRTIISVVDQFQAFSLSQIGSLWSAASTDPLVAAHCWISPRPHPLCKWIGPSGNCYPCLPSPCTQLWNLNPNVRRISCFRDPGSSSKHAANTLLLKLCYIRIISSFQWSFWSLRLAACSQPTCSLQADWCQHLKYRFIEGAKNVLVQEGHLLSSTKVNECIKILQHTY